MNGLNIYNKWDKYNDEIFQVYCSSENGVNKWLEENNDKAIIDIQSSLDEEGELITVIYKVSKKGEVK